MADWDDDSDWDDFPHEADDDAVETVTCRNCGADIYEDAPQCPVCGQYVTRAGVGNYWSDRPVWWIVLGGIGVVATIIALSLA